MFIWELNCWLTWKWSSGVEQYYQDSFVSFPEPNSVILITGHHGVSRVTMRCYPYIKKWILIVGFAFMKLIFSHNFFILDFLSCSKTRCVFKAMVSSTADIYIIWDEKLELKTIAEEINLAGYSCEDNNRSWQITLHKCSIIIIWFVAFQCDEMITSQSDSESPNFQCLHD